MMDMNSIPLLSRLKQAFALCILDYKAIVLLQAPILALVILQMSTSYFSLNFLDQNIFILPVLVFILSVLSLLGWLALYYRLHSVYKGEPMRVTTCLKQVFSVSWHLILFVLTIGGLAFAVFTSISFIMAMVFHINVEKFNEIGIMAILFFAIKAIFDTITYFGLPWVLFEKVMPLRAIQNSVWFVRHALPKSYYLWLILSFMLSLSWQLGGIFFPLTMIVGELLIILMLIYDTSVRVLFWEDCFQAFQVKSGVLASAK